MTTIGIDFGTSNIYVAVWNKGIIKIIPNSSAAKKSPSFIVLEDGNEDNNSYAEEARAQSTIDTGLSIFDIKQFIGLSNQEAQKVIKDQSYPFRLTAGSSGKNLAFTLIDGRTVLVFDLARLLFKQAREQYLNYLEKDQAVVNCLITVPESWTNERKDILTEAALYAGFKKAKWINSHVAAVAGCFFHTLDSQKFSKNIVVVQVGACKTTVAVFTEEDNRRSLATSVPSVNMGGNTVDINLIRHCLEECKTIVTTENAFHRLRLEFQNAKLRLTTRKSTPVSVPNLCDGQDFYCDLKIKTLENLSDALAKKVLELTKQALTWASLDVNKDPYQILLLGGSSRLHTVRHLMSEYFGDSINSSVLLYPEDGEVYGAAGFARMFDLVPDLMRIDIGAHYRSLSAIFRAYGSSEESLSAALISYVEKEKLQQVAQECHSRAKRQLSETNVFSGRKYIKKEELKQAGHEGQESKKTPREPVPAEIQDPKLLSHTMSLLPAGNNKIQSSLYNISGNSHNSSNNTGHSLHHPIHINNRLTKGESIQHPGLLKKVNPQNGTPQKKDQQLLDKLPGQGSQNFLHQKLGMSKSHESFKQLVDYQKTQAGSAGFKSNKTLSASMRSRRIAPPPPGVQVHQRKQAEAPRPSLLRRFLNIFLD